MRVNELHVRRVRKFLLPTSSFLLRHFRRCKFPWVLLPSFLFSFRMRATLRALQRVLLVHKFWVAQKASASHPQLPFGTHQAQASYRRSSAWGCLSVLQCNVKFLRWRLSSAHLKVASRNKQETKVESWQHIARTSSWLRLSSLTITYWTLAHISHVM